ncbi:sirohydrochlorin chelatase [Nocardioides sp.]|uniref:sirohydrochlorin chelatase n=1 Tax=Nocardioides sp. TaxID=35761 RepID=UPI003510F89E
MTARLITVAHGTRTAAGNTVAVELTRAAGERLGVEAVASYVELCEPLFADVVAAEAVPTVVVPLLLSTGMHVREDLPEAVAGAPDPSLVHLGGPLGPDPLLAAAQVERLREVGAVEGQRVVLLAAGSNDPAVDDDLDGAAADLAAAWGGEVVWASMTGRGPRLADVARPGDAVSPYLLAAGYFRTQAREQACDARASVVADVIGPHPRVVELICERVAAAGVRA